MQRVLDLALCMHAQRKDFSCSSCSEVLKLALVLGLAFSPAGTCGRLETRVNHYWNKGSESKDRPGLHVLNNKWLYELRKTDRCIKMARIALQACSFAGLQQGAP